ncbi:MAG: hypothetical protein M1828_006976 [Chrysothrix sp. TS-e1954]|nr:MAG: hypothetical protein M1828_006976 [Chrysothrix sp. TS-e1954]
MKYATAALATLAALASPALAAYQGFNYGSTESDGQTPVTYDSFKTQFNRQKSLQGTSGFSSARLYTMIQGGTADTPSEAFQAAIDTDTSLLMGMWASGGQAGFTSELNAFEAAISAHGEALSSRIVGISVGSEDLYRITPTGIANKAGIGAGPDVIVSFINQLRSAIKNTAAKGALIGHVDTWTAYVNGSNNAAIAACDFLGVDAYPYFQTTENNGIAVGRELFFEAYRNTTEAAQGKPVWITETGWPVSGPQSGNAAASIANAKQYWDDVACTVLGNVNTYWYTLQDSAPTVPSPSFGIIGQDITAAPLYSLSCSGHEGTVPGGTNSGSGASKAGAGSASSSGSSGAKSSPSKSGTSGSKSEGSGSEGSGSGSKAEGSGTEGSGSKSEGSGSEGSGSGSGSEGSTSPKSTYVGKDSTVTVEMTTYTTTTKCPTTYTSEGSEQTSYSTSTMTVTDCKGGCPSASATGAVSTAAPAQSAAPQPAAPAPAASSSPSSGKSCPAALSGAYEYPHLIVPISSVQADRAYGTSYNGTVSQTESSLFNFDIPQSDEGKTCSLVFLLPTKDELETSSFALTGYGGLDVKGLSKPATESTTYNSCPSKTGEVGSVKDVTPGNSYVIGSFECPAGKAVGYEVSSTGSLSLDYFQDYNPSPIGLYITVC